MKAEICFPMLTLEKEQPSDLRKILALSLSSSETTGLNLLEVSMSWTSIASSEVGAGPSSSLLQEVTNVTLLPFFTHLCHPCTSLELLLPTPLSVFTDLVMETSSRSLAAQNWVSDRSSDAEVFV